VGSLTAEKAPAESVQLKRKFDAPLLPIAKATPSVTKYLLVLRRVVVACERGANASRLDTTQECMNREGEFFVIEWKVNEYV
jgi:hypothetical protein